MLGRAAGTAAALGLVALLTIAIARPGTVAAAAPLHDRPTTNTRPGLSWARCLAGSSGDRDLAYNFANVTADGSGLVLAATVHEEGGPRRTLLVELLELDAPCSSAGRGRVGPAQWSRKWPIEDYDGDVEWLVVLDDQSGGLVLAAGVHDRVVLRRLDRSTGATVWENDSAVPGEFASSGTARLVQARAAAGGGQAVQVTAGAAPGRGRLHELVVSVTTVDAATGRVLAPHRETTIDLGASPEIGVAAAEWDTQDAFLTRNLLPLRDGRVAYQVVRHYNRPAGAPDSGSRTRAAEWLHVLTASDADGRVRLDVAVLTAADTNYARWTPRENILSQPDRDHVVVRSATRSGSTYDDGLAIVSLSSGEVVRRHATKRAGPEGDLLWDVAPAGVRCGGLARLGHCVLAMTGRNYVFHAVLYDRASSGVPADTNLPPFASTHAPRTAGGGGGGLMPEVAGVYEEYENAFVECGGASPFLLVTSEAVPGFAFLVGSGGGDDDAAVAMVASFKLTELLGEGAFEPVPRSSSASSGSTRVTVAAAASVSVALVACAAACAAMWCRRRRRRRRRRRARCGQSSDVRERARGGAGGKALERTKEAAARCGDHDADRAATEMTPALERTISDDRRAKAAPALNAVPSSTHPTAPAAPHVEAQAAAVPGAHSMRHIEVEGLHDSTPC